MIVKIASRYQLIKQPYWEGEIEDQGSAAKTLGAAVNAARKAGVVLTGADLMGADLTGADLTGADLRGAVLTGAVLTGADLTGADLRGAVLTGADLMGAVLTGAVLTGAVLTGAVLTGELKVAKVRVFTGLYQYICMSILSSDGMPWVRMGCLWKTVSEWDSIGIRKSNLGEFPDDGSPKCEERVRAFEFTRTAALLLSEESKGKK